MSFILNLFGIGYRCKPCYIPHDTFQEMQLECTDKTLSWENAFSDSDFLNRHGYLSLSAIPSSRSFVLFPLIAQNRFEIKQRSRFLVKTSALDLTNEGLLFDRYNLEIKPLNIQLKKEHQVVLVVIEENGLIGKFELNHENIQVDLLYYNCLDIDLPGINTICLTGISYQGEALKAKKQDTVVRGIQVILL